MKEGVPSRIVTVEPYGMGDVISLRPLIEALCQKGIQVDLLIQSRWFAIYSDLPVRLHDISAGWSDLGWIGSLKWIWRCRGMLGREGQCVVGIDSRADCRSTLLLAVMGCSEIILPNYFLGTDAATPAGPWKSYDDLGCTQPRWKLNVQALDLLRVSNSALPIAAPNLEFLTAGFSESKSEGTHVGILPCVPWAGRQWCPEHWRKLIQKLVEIGEGVTVICGPGQRKEASEITGVSISEILGVRTIPELVGTLRTCRVIISLDSGPIHLAAALKLPIVGIYGPGQLPMWEPVTLHSRVVSRQAEFADGPVHQISRNHEISRRMMEAISVGEVWAAYESLDAELRANQV